MSDLTADNANQVTKTLIKIGLQPGAGVGLPGDVPMKDVAGPELKRLRDAAIGVLGDTNGDVYVSTVARL